MRLADAGEDAGVDLNVALAAAGGNDHIGVIEEFGIAGDASVGEREARGIDPVALPRFHLSLIALFRNLLVERERRQSVDDVRREALVVVRRRIAALDMSPGGLKPLAETREQTDAGDPHLAAFSHFANSLTMS